MIEFRTLKNDELEKWFDHCMYVFNEGIYSREYRQYFVNHYNNDPWRDLDTILVCMDDNKIASTVRIFNRKIYLNSKEVSMGGIGEVSTKSEYRSQGLSTKLLEIAIEKMKNMGINVSILGAAQNKFGYYNRLGWDNIPRCFNASNVKGNNNFKFKIRPINFETDITEIISIYNNYSKKLNGTLVRNEKYYWENWVKNEAKNFYIVEDNNKIISYIDFEKNNNVIKIREFGELLHSKSIFKELLSKIVYLEGEEECKVIYPKIIKSELKIEEVIKEMGLMINVINPFEFKGIKIENTKDFIKIFNNINKIQNEELFTFWDIDGF